MTLVDIQYNRAATIEYAYKWAKSRNPRYFSFDNFGGDCTNFASQCLYAGCKVMNYTPIFGWYYINGNEKSPSWTGVPYFYNFLTNNKLAGPRATDSSITKMQIGDFLQLGGDNGFYHTLLIVGIDTIPTEKTIYLAAHTNDVFGKALSSYYYNKVRYLHIDGVRKWV